MPLLVWLVLCIALPSAYAERLDWTFALDPDHVAVIEIRDAEDRLVHRMITQDGASNSRQGWRPDLDPERGWVRGELTQLWLPAGTYRVIERLPEADYPRDLEVVADTDRLVLVVPPRGADGVSALHLGPGYEQDRSCRDCPAPDMDDGFAWAPVEAGRFAFLGLGPGRWRAQSTGDARSDEVIIEPGDERVALEVWRRSGERTPDDSRQTMVRLGLLPPTVIFLLVACVGVWRQRKRLPPVLELVGVGLACLALGLVAVSRLLGAFGERILLASPALTDPLDSVAQLHCMAGGLGGFTDVCTSYGWPEGSTWMTTGPSWLGYLLPALATRMSDGLVGHNIGVLLGVVLLAFASWALARSLGAGPICSLLAAGGAAWSPVLLAELSLASLDRTSLYLVPVFFLALHKAETEDGWGWPVAAGSALAAVFYCQLHYGLYLAAAAPLLVLPRLVGARPLQRLGRMALVGVVAAVLLVPGLWVLQEGTAGTPYHADDTRLVDQVDDLLHPVSVEEAQEYIDAHDPRRGLGQDPPMSSSTDRLLAASARSVNLRDFSTPAELFPGRVYFWLLVVGAILLARPRRRTGQAALDVMVLLVFALGPFLRLDNAFTGIPLPYYLNFLLIPGFEQLKQVNRYVLMAATIAPVPIALGVHAVARRLQDRWPGLARPRVTLLGVPVVALLLVWLVAVRAVGVSFSTWPPKLRFAEAKSRSLGIVRFDLPAAADYARVPALEGLEPGPALALPLDEPTPAAISVSACQAGLPLLNSPPFGMPDTLKHPFWYETNALLNRLARASGSTRPQRNLGGGRLEADVEELLDTGLRYVLLYRDQLAGPLLAEDTEALLDAWCGRLADDGSVVVWDLSLPPEG